MPNQVLPVSSSRRAPDGQPEQANFTAPRPNGVINILQASVRLGNKGPSMAVGLVQKLEWSIKRKTKEVYQLEALPNVIFGIPRTPSSDLTVIGQYERAGDYYPGEPIEIVPGVQEPIELTLERAVMNSGTGLEALLATGDAAEYAPYNAGVGYEPFIAQSAFATTESGDPARGINPLQQVRPLALYSLIFSPTTGEIIYGIKFIDTWIEEISGWNLEAAGDGPIIESIKMRCPRIRLVPSNAA
jgi:hypothetical protein